MESLTTANCIQYTSGAGLVSTYINWKKESTQMTHVMMANYKTTMRRTMQRSLECRLDKMLMNVLSSVICQSDSPVGQ